MKATFFLQLVPRFSSGGTLVGLQAVAARVRANSGVRPGAFQLKLQVDIPDRAFAPLPVTISVPDSALTRADEIKVVVAP